MTINQQTFTNDQLEEFDRLTAMESSLNQISRITARLEYPMWFKKNNLTKEQTDDMRDELIRQGRW